MIEQRRVASVVETAETPDCSDHAGVSGDRAAYGIGRKTIVSMVDGIYTVTKTFAGLSGFVFLLFLIGQFLAYFTYSYMATIVAENMGDALEHADLGTTPLMFGFIRVTGVVGLLIVGVIPKSALLAPIFVPLFMKLGVAPRPCWQLTAWATRRQTSSPR